MDALCVTLLELFILLCSVTPFGCSANTNLQLLCPVDLRITFYSKKYLHQIWNFSPGY